VYAGGRDLEEGAPVTEAEWLASEDPRAMLEFLQGKVSDRKLRLFAIACCRRIERLIDDPRSRAALEFADLHAETGVARRKGRPALERAAQEAHWDVYTPTYKAPPSESKARAEVVANARFAPVRTLQSDAMHAALCASIYSWHAVAWEAQLASGCGVYHELLDEYKQPEQAEQARLLRDLPGDTFHPAMVNPEWLTWNGQAPLKIARGIYDEKAFDRLPILADALEDAGCADPDLLGHLRSPGPHVRGCWALDLILGKG
jgi:hypothetical protein